MKRREIFSVIILVIFLQIGGCGGDGGGSSSGTSGTGGTISLAWDAPTKNADGTDLTDLKGYWIYYGTTPGAYAERTYAGNVTTYIF